MAIASSFHAICDMIPLWGKNFTVFEIQSALVFGMYIRWHML